MAARKVIHTVLSALAFSALLFVTTGCNVGTRDSGSPLLASTDMVDVRAMGSVGDGPIANARIEIRSASGQLLATSKSSPTADYDVSFRTQGRHYPLRVTADQGTDLVTNITPDFALVSGIISPSVNSVINLNPYTTLVFLTAEKSGGINSTNIAAANTAVLARYGFGLDTRLVPDPLTTPMDGSNVHAIVKASETMGEMIRRTRNALNLSSTATVHGDHVVAALAADLTDGWIDGNGATGHSARIAAIANVATAAVMVQAMANRLEWHHSTGATKNITGHMDRAIRTVRPTAPDTSNTENVPIPQEALDQTIRALEAASLLVTDARIATIINELREVQSGAKPRDIEHLLPKEIDSVLNLAVLMTADAETDTIAAINTVARFGLPAEPDNSGPVEEGPVEAGPIEEGPIEEGPVEAGPIEEGPVEAGPVEEGPVEAGPVEEGPIQTVGTAMVAWTPPTQYSDGTFITDLAGHRVYYGTDPNALTRIIDVPGTAYNEQYIDNLDPGTWHFAVSAYNKKGAESKKSSIKSKTIY
jgi:hypothetical protein